MGKKKAIGNNDGRTTPEMGRAIDNGVKVTKAKAKVKVTAKSDSVSFKEGDQETRIDILTEVQADLAKAKTKEDVAAVFKKWYMTVGLRHPGRLLLGKAPKDIAGKK